MSTRFGDLANDRRTLLRLELAKLVFQPCRPGRSSGTSARRSSFGIERRWKRSSGQAQAPRQAGTWPRRWVRTNGENRTGAARLQAVPDFRAAMACTAARAPGHRGVVRNAMGQRATADREAVGDRLRRGRGVDHKLHLARTDRVDAMRPAFQHLVDDHTGSPASRMRAAVPRVARWRSPSRSAGAQGRQAAVVGVLHRQEHSAAFPAGLHPAPSWRFGESAFEADSRGPSPRRWISFPGPGSCPRSGKRANGKTASFTATCGASARRHRD